MSRTIITKNNIDIFTNVSSEQLFGLLCKNMNLKHAAYNSVLPPSMAYSMEEKETKELAVALRGLIKNDDSEFNKYKHFFFKGATYADFNKFLTEYANLFELSGGYECI